MPVRLIIALSVAGVLAVFLLYTSFAGGATPSIRPSQVPAFQDEPVSLAGIVIGPVTGDARGEGLRFWLKDFDGDTTVQVIYKGRVPDLFREERHVFLVGTFAGSGVLVENEVQGEFIGKADTMVTKCPSKYAPVEDDAHPGAT